MTTLVVTRGVSTAWLVMGPFPLDTALAPHTSWPGLSGTLSGLPKTWTRRPSRTMNRPSSPSNTP
jgi:hypothetical protein